MAPEKAGNDKRFIAGILFTVLGAAGFSAKAILAKLCYRYGISGFATLTLRMMMALPMYMAIFWWYYRKQDETTRKGFRKDWISISIVGLFGYYLASWFDFVGLEYVSASFERLLLFIYPTLVLLISLFWLKTRAGKREVAALLITYIGIGIAYHNETALSGLNANIGAVYIIFAAVTYAVYLVATEKLARHYSPLVFTSFAIIISALAIILHGTITREKLWGFPTPVYFYTLAMAIFCTVLPSLFVAQGIAMIGSNRAAILSTLGPVMTIYLAFVVLGDDFTPAQAIGTACVLAGIAMLTIRRRQAVSHE
ncbi:MAG: DMT family transporter [Leptospiraceae bacterium]|nr:DMT family transporter [Leptospiraceae bacterium]